MRAEIKHANIKSGGLRQPESAPHSRGRKEGTGGKEKGCGESNPAQATVPAQLLWSIFWCKTPVSVLPLQCVRQPRAPYEDEVYLVTALVPSDTACLASSPGRARRTAVWISREVSVPFLL